MKHIKTKAQIRQELNQQVDAYLGSGGAVSEVNKGVSGNPNNTQAFHGPHPEPPKQERTDLTDVIKALDERKAPEKKVSSPVKRAKKILITDDFGEPLRWVWSE